MRNGVSKLEVAKCDIKKDLGEMTVEQQIIATRCKALVEPLSAELLHNFHARGHTSPRPQGTHAVGRKRDRARGKLFSIKYAPKENLAPSVRELGMSAYRVVSKLPKDLKGELPLPEQIEMLLRDEPC